MIRLRHPTEMLEAQFSSLDKFVSEPFVKLFTNYPGFVRFAIDPNSFIYARYRDSDVVVGYVVTGATSYHEIFDEVNLDDIRGGDDTRLYDKIVNQQLSDTLMQDFISVSERLLQRCQEHYPQDALRMYGLLMDVQQLSRFGLK